MIPCELTEKDEFIRNTKKTIDSLIRNMADRIIAIDNLPCDPNIKFIGLSEQVNESTGNIISKNIED